MQCLLIPNCLNTSLICTVLFWPIQIRTAQLYTFQGDSEVEQSKSENTSKNSLIDEIQKQTVEILDMIYYVFLTFRLASSLHIQLWLPRHQEIIWLQELTSAQSLPVILSVFCTNTENNPATILARFKGQILNLDEEKINTPK